MPAAIQGICKDMCGVSTRGPGPISVQSQAAMQILHVTAAYVDTHLYILETDDSTV